MKTNNIEFKFYNYDKIFSYNSVFNFLLGHRGLGKTFGAKYKGISKFLKTGEQFIYLRRYKTELESKNTFFDDIIAEGKFPDYDFRVNGNRAEVSHKSKASDKKRQWDTMGYFIALSTAQKQKSIAYPLVTLIIFDEFIIEKGALHYLQNEATAFEGFYITVDRNKDKTKVLFLANSVSIINPYFIHYGIEPKKDVEFLSLKKNFILCHFPTADEHRDAVYHTRFGEFLSGTAHADYAFNNQFADNHDGLIKKKIENAKYISTIEARQGFFSVWYYGGVYYIQESRPRREMILTLDPIKMREGKTLVETNDKFMQILRTAYRNELMFFDKPKTRNIFLEVFKR